MQAAKFVAAPIGSWRGTPLKDFLKRLEATTSPKSDNCSPRITPAKATTRADRTQRMHLIADALAGAIAQQFPAKI
jgi:hypothetical protein